MMQPNIEFCSTGIVQSIIAKSILKVASIAQVGILQSCNRVGEIRAYNISYMNSSAIQLTPSGDYRSVFRLFDDIDDNVFNVSYYSTIFH